MHAFVELPIELSNESFEYDDVDDDSEDTNTFENIIVKIRQACWRVRRSEVLTNKLVNFCEETNVKFINPVLDGKTRWDSTCDLMEAAKKLKPALEVLWEYCPEPSKFKLGEDSIVYSIALKRIL